MNRRKTVRTKRTPRSVKGRPPGKDLSTKKVGTAINPCSNFCMPRQQTQFTWESSGIYNTATALAPYSTSRYLPTRLQDLDPAAGTTAVPGLAAWSGLYRKYRTFSSKITVTFVNLETFPVKVFVCPDNSDPVAFPIPQQYLSNPLCKHMLLSPKGGMDRVTLTNFASVAQFGGSASHDVEDNYCGNVDGSSNPTDNYYWYVGIVNPPAQVAVSGVFAETILRVHTDLYEVQTPPS